MNTHADFNATLPAKALGEINAADASALDSLLCSRLVQVLIDGIWGAVKRLAGAYRRKNEYPKRMHYGLLRRSRGLSLLIADRRDQSALGGKVTFLSLATAKLATFLVITSSALFILGAHSSALAANPSSGLTIITHGFQPPAPVSNGALPGWVTEMAQAIRNRVNPEIPIYRIRYDKATDTVLLQDGATVIDITQSGSAIILLDWVGVADEEITYPAQFVADRFFLYLFNRLHNGHYLAELPIHLIGHSRGASLNSRLVYQLAENGILVEQVTTLDPHPVKPWDFPISGNDLDPETFSNVIFADNYYRTGVPPAGQPVAGAKIPQDLSNIITGELLSPVQCSGHVLVHTYYHGTIALSQTTDGDCHIYNLWYQTSTARWEDGYNFSRYTNYLVARPASGVNQFIANAGGTGSRVDVTSTFQFWPNVGFDQRGIYPARVTVGQTYNIPYYYADRSSLQTITFFTDSGTNPFDVNAVRTNISQG